MNGRELLEVVCSRAWPALVEEPLGDWRLRWADGFTGRANSALAVGDAGVPLRQALSAVCDFAHAHGIPPMVQVIRDSPNEQAIAAAGWREAREHPQSHEVVVLAGPLDAASPADGALVLDEPTIGWWELTADTAEPTPAQRHVLSSGKVGYGVLEIDGVESDGVPAGAVRGAVVDGWLHIARLAVRPAFRRRGIASALMAALGAWGSAQGVDRCVLQVAESNAAALALYAALGYAPRYRYRYWVPATAPCEDSTS